jgi:hypothetical protein
MQHSGDADPGTKPFRIGGNGRECLGRHFEQQAVDQRLVLVRDRTQLGRQREPRPSVSTMTWRLRPFTFLPAS